MIPQNMPQTLNSLISSTNNKVAKGNQGQTMLDIKSSETINHPAKMDVTPQNMTKVPIPYYHPLNE